MVDGNAAAPAATTSVTVNITNVSQSGTSWMTQLMTELGEWVDQKFSDYMEAINNAKGKGSGEGSDDGQEPKFEVQSNDGKNLKAEFTDENGKKWDVDIKEGGARAEFTNQDTGESFTAWGDPHLNVNGKHEADFEGNVTFDMPNSDTKMTLVTTNPNGDGSTRTFNGMTLTDQVVFTNGDWGVSVTGIADGESGNLSVNRGDGYTMDYNAYDGQVTFSWSNDGWVDQSTGQSISDYGKQGLMQATAYANHGGDVPTTDAVMPGPGQPGGPGGGEGGSKPSDDLAVKAAQGEFERAMSIATEAIKGAIQASKSAVGR